MPLRHQVARVRRRLTGDSSSRGSVSPECGRLAADSFAVKDPTRDGTNISAALIAADDVRLRRSGLVKRGFRPGGGPIHWLRLETKTAHEAEDAILLEEVAASFEITRWQ